MTAIPCFESRSVGNLVASAALIVTFALAAPPGLTRGLPMDRAIPELSVTGPDGKVIALSSMKGRALIVMAARDDDRSRNAIEDIASLFRDSPDLAESARVVVVWSGEIKPDVAASVSKLAHEGLPFAAAFDPKGAAFNALQIVATPTLDIVDKDGVLRYHLPGYPQNFHTQLAMALQQRLGLKIPFQPDEDKSTGMSHPAGTTRHVALAQILLREGRVESARSTLENARQAWPDDSRIGTMLGFVRLKAGETVEARAMFAKVLEIDPDNDQAQAGMCACMIEMGEIDAARENLHALEARRPDSAHAQYYLGVIADKEQRPEEAAQRYRDALRLVVPEL
jgi:Tfp pilus assembly protein PilF